MEIVGVTSGRSLTFSWVRLRGEIIIFFEVEVKVGRRLRTYVLIVNGIFR